MKTTATIAASLAVAAFSVLSLSAASYSDSTGENFTTAGGGILDQHFDCKIRKFPAISSAQGRGVA